MIQRLVSAAVIGLVLVSGLFFDGCINVDFGVEVNVSNLTDDQRERTARGAARWNAVTDDDHKIHLVTDGGICVRIVPQGEIPTSIAGATGLYSADEGRIYIDELATGDTFEMVMEHELGHSIGVGHHNGVGVMRVSGGQLDLSPDDKAQCHKDGAC